jgi:hypothetical protein
VNPALRFLGLALGVAIVVWLVARADLAALFGVFPRIGWGFLAILAARAATVVVDCAAWYCLVPRAERPGFAVMLPLRWIAESINTTLPAAQVGGDVVRARLLQRRVALPARGTASVAVDFCLSLFAQILFTLLGFVLLARLGDAAGWWPAAVSAALVPAFAVLSWELLVRRRLLSAAERGAERLGQHQLAAALRALGIALGLVAGFSSRQLSRPRRRVVADALSDGYLSGLCRGDPARKPEPWRAQRRLPDPLRMGCAGSNLGRPRQPHRAYRR